MTRQRFTFFCVGVIGLMIGLFAEANPEMTAARPVTVRALAIVSALALLLGLIPLIADFLKRKTYALLARLAHRESPVAHVDHQGVRFGIASALVFLCAGLGMVLCAVWNGSRVSGDARILIAFGLGLLLSSYFSGRRLEQRERGHE
jgi:hypothetical protein